MQFLNFWQFWGRNLGFWLHSDCHKMQFLSKSDSLEMLFLNFCQNHTYKNVNFWILAKFWGLIRLESLYLIFICLHMKNHLSDLQIHTIFWKTKINIANHVSLFQFWYFDNLLDKSKSEQNGTGRLERSHQLYSYHINSDQFSDWHAGEVESFVEY